MKQSSHRPSVALTMGDVAGIGPEVIIKAWSDLRLHQLARPLVIGNASILRKSAKQLGSQAEVIPIDSPEQADPAPLLIPCIDPKREDSKGNLLEVAPGVVDARAGAYSYRFLVQAIDLALAGRIDALTTLPISKKSLQLAGIPYPGHTEILADRCGVVDHAMMLYLASGSPTESPRPGLGVVHVTLHMALRRIFESLTIANVKSKIHLADRAMRPLTEGCPPRIAVAALNPHAGEDQLFGDEEQTMIKPAVDAARASGVDVSGPYPADSLFQRALGGEFDAIVAMYHDQGHIPLKAVGFNRSVNVTLGLPIVRTSVAHGTAFDIAWKGLADPSSLIEAVRIAARIVHGNRQSEDESSR